MNSPAQDWAKIVAHEMRSPLAAIHGALEVLRIGASDPAVVADMRERIARQVHQLTRLVNDLMAEQQLAHMPFELHKERIDLVSAIRAAIETTQPLFEHLGHSLETALPAASVIVEGDSDRLTQVFVNLLENAARYTQPYGLVALSVEPGGSQVRVKVLDSGTGIDPELLPHVFDIHVRGAAPARSRTAGMGIGLAVARAVIEAHGGTISASSDGPDQGSVFVVKLPAAAHDGSFAN
jgi:signal transduction histidine kinase